MSITNKLILGTVQFGLDYGINNTAGKPDQQAVNKILNVAFENNIQLLDTAEVYGNAQEVIGNYHGESSNIFKVMTKFSSSRTDLPADITERIKKDIDILGIETLYCYMFHNYADFKSYYAKFDKDIAVLKKEGLIEKMGVSIYTNEELEDLLHYDEVDLVQLPFNLLDNTLQRGDILKRAKQKGIEIHTRSAFLQGLFFKELDNLPPKIKPLTTSIEIVKQIANSHTLEMASLALNYAYQQEFIDNVLIGVDTVEQLELNMKCLEKPISHTIIEQINGIDVAEKTLLNPSNWN